MQHNGAVVSDLSRHPSWCTFPLASPWISCGSACVACTACVCIRNLTFAVCCIFLAAPVVVAQINVNVTYGGPQFGRVVTANDAVTRGDLLASIPLDLAWNTATSGGNGSMQVCHTAGSQPRSNF
jgi:hypothetical protein